MNVAYVFDLCRKGWKEILPKAVEMTQADKVLMDLQSNEIQLMKKIRGIVQELKDACDIAIDIPETFGLIPRVLLSGDEKGEEYLVFKFFEKIEHEEEEEGCLGDEQE